jgi:hypothetical protein
MISDVARKYRRALRNGTGVRFTLAELQALADIGTLEALQTAEARELQAKWPATSHPTPPASSGLIAGPTASLPHGKSPGMTKKREPSAIAALVARG